MFVAPINIRLVIRLTRAPPLVRRGKAEQLSEAYSQILDLNEND
jgi:hypothetical protein